MRQLTVNRLGWSGRDRQIESTRTRNGPIATLVADLLQSFDDALIPMDDDDLQPTYVLSD